MDTGLNMSTEHGHGDQAWTWTPRRDMNTGHEHEHQIWTWKKGMDINPSMDMDEGYSRL